MDYSKSKSKNDTLNMDDETKQQIEDTILNMKIIGSIQKSDKLGTNDSNILEIENRDVFQGIRRWYMGRNRGETLGNIKTVINQSFDITDKTLSNERKGNTFTNERYFNEENSNLLQRFLVEMNSACKGLDNLKDTYSGDVKVTSEIDLLKDQLQIRIRKINSLLKIDNNVVDNTDAQT